MRVSNNIYKPYAPQAKHPIKQKNVFHTPNYSTNPTFTGNFDERIKGFFSKEMPLKRAIEYLDKASETFEDFAIKYLKNELPQQHENKKAYKLYKKAADTLEKHWNQLDEADQSKFIQAYLGMAASQTINNQPKALKILKKLFAKLAALNSPLATNKEALNDILIGVQIIGNTAKLDEKIAVAQKTYKFGIDITQHAKEKGITLMYNKQVPAETFFFKELAILERLEKNLPLR